MNEKNINDEGTLEWWERKEKRKQIKKKIKNKTESKCITCVWGDAETGFCMFPKCFVEFDKRRKK